MCIRDSLWPAPLRPAPRARGRSGLAALRGRLRRGRYLLRGPAGHGAGEPCLLYTSDAADERSSVDLGGRRIIKKKTRRFVCVNSDCVSL